jgi:hypothetical protein
VSVRMRPQRFLCRCGTTSRAKYTLLRKFSSRARCHSSRSRQETLWQAGLRVGDADIDASEFLRDSGDEVANGSRIGHAKGIGRNVQVMLLSDLLRRGAKSAGCARAHGDAAPPDEHFRRGHGQSLDSRLRPARLDLMKQE